MKSISGIFVLDQSLTPNLAYARNSERQTPVPVWQLAERRYTWSLYA